MATTIVRAAGGGKGDRKGGKDDGGGDEWCLRQLVGDRRGEEAKDGGMGKSGRGNE